MWSGSISTDEPVTLDAAKVEIKKRNNIKRLPARTIVVSASMLSEFAKWNAQWLTDVLGVIFVTLQNVDIKCDRQDADGGS